MARITLLSWNIEVYGPTKYATGPNTYRLIKFVATTIAAAGANLVVLIELSNSVADQICKSLTDELYAVTKNKWKFQTIAAKPGGDRERYGILWRQAGVNFGEINVSRDQMYLQLSEQQFPDNRGQMFGRRAAIAGFRTTDTGFTFAVSAYHAPPPADANSTWAWAGVEALAKSNDLYQLNMSGDMGKVSGRMLAGDYNLDVNNDQSFLWLTNPVPYSPPPKNAGQGAGTRPISTSRTHLISMDEVQRRWGRDINGWGTDPGYYIELPIDDIFYASPSQTQQTGGVFNLMQWVMAPDTSLRGLAQGFERYNFGQAAFPNSTMLPTPLSQALSDPRAAWLLIRYAISDHFPVYVSIDI